MKKGIIIGILISTLLLTGCTMNKKEEVLKDINTVMEYNVYEEGATTTNIRLTVTNNSKKKYQINKIKFDITLKNNEVKNVQKKLNCTVKAGKKYNIEVKADVVPSEIESISYTTE